jgi:carbon monoxide dehydrogenase subunit G
MQLNNEFTVDASVAETWELLTDLERIMPCMPGAGLDGREGEDYLGNVKIKVGPISAHFRGAARFVEQDDAAHKATIRASGKDAKGQASASATVCAWLEPETERRTRVFVDTDLDISGRMAQFGRGAIADVSNRLIGQFTENLGREIIRGQQAAAPAGVAAGSPVSYAAPAAAGPSVAAPEVNMLAVLAPTIAKFAAGPVIGLLLGILIGQLTGRRRG